MRTPNDAPQDLTSCVNNSTGIIKLSRVIYKMPRGSDAPTTQITIKQPIKYGDFGIYTEIPKFSCPVEDCIYLAADFHGDFIEGIQYSTRVCTNPDVVLRYASEKRVDIPKLPETPPLTSVVAPVQTDNVNEHSTNSLLDKILQYVGIRK